MWYHCYTLCVVEILAGLFTWELLTDTKEYIYICNNTKNMYKQWQYLKKLVINIFLCTLTFEKWCGSVCHAPHMDILFINLFTQSFFFFFKFSFFNRVDLCMTDHEISAIKCIQHCFITSSFSMLYFAAHYQDVTKILQSFGKMTKSFSGNYCVWFYQHSVHSCPVFNQDTFF